MELAVLALAGTATAFATGLGSVPVFLLGERARTLRPFLWGTTVGLMGVASVIGLLLPALDEDGGASVAAGLVAGVAFLLGSRLLLAGRDVHVGELHGAGVRRSRSAPPSRRTPRGSRCSSSWRSRSRTSRRARAWPSPWRAPASVERSSSGRRS
jgi:hypothetical protein